VNETVEFGVRSLMIGVGATLAMDVWAAVLRSFGVPSLKPMASGASNTR
jgi:hypothetical protein